MTIPQLSLPLVLLLAASCTSSGTNDVDPGDDTSDDDTSPCTAVGALTLGTPPDVLGGGTHQFYVLDNQEAGYAEERPGCALSWSVDGAAGATINQTGLLAASSTVTPGSALTVTATLATGETLSVTAWVYTLATHPQVGRWEETARISCADGSETAPTPYQKVNELYIRTDGHTQVTWTPFETYVDYWVDVAFASPSVIFGTPAGSRIPSDLDGTGTFELDGEDLVLRDMYLGTIDGPSTAFCGHRFERY